MRNNAPINHFSPTPFSPNRSPIYGEAHLFSQSGSERDHGKVSPPANPARVARLAAGGMLRDGRRKKEDSKGKGGGHFFSAVQQGRAGSWLILLVGPEALHHSWPMRAGVGGCENARRIASPLLCLKLLRFFSLPFASFSPVRSRQKLAPELPIAV
jgi:hypothetical protein